MKAWRLSHLSHKTALHPPLLSSKMVLRLPLPSSRMAGAPRPSNKMVLHLPARRTRRPCACPSVEHKGPAPPPPIKQEGPAPPPPVKQDVLPPPPPPQWERMSATVCTSTSGANVPPLSAPPPVGANIPPPSAPPPPVEQENGACPAPCHKSSCQVERRPSPKNPVRERVKAPQGEAEKASQKERKKQRAEEDEAYQIALANFDLEMDVKAEEIAEKFHKTSTMSRHCPAGEKHPLRDLQKMVREDPRFQNMTDKDEEALIVEFEARPDKKVVGTCLSNAAAARNVTAFTKRIHHE
ncbi:hypothetical protein B0H13DRAFT_1898424, partial [Mycena leptocephala]